MPGKSITPILKRNQRRSPRRRRWSFWRVVVVFGWLLGITVVVAAVGAAMLYLYCKPSYELAQTYDLEKVDDLEVASVIFDRNGEELGRIFVQNREPISIDKVSENFVNALLAAEDSRFFEHTGVDYLGILRAVLLNFKAGEFNQGASTITQQLARNAFDLRERTIRRKVTEAFLAQRIEREIHDKRKILELYMNRIYFGSGYYGISAAANGFFGKEAKDLTVAEAATLAGVIRNPYYRSPRHFPDSSKATRDSVFRRMRKEGMIDRKQLNALLQEPLTTIPKGSITGRSKFVYERVRQQVIDLIGYEKASEGGFQIHTTIDSKVQRAAEEKLAAQLTAMENHKGYSHQTIGVYKAMKQNFLDTAEEGAHPPAPNYLQGAALMIDNQTGAIIALVGGRDFNDSMYDRTLQARRPPGTAFVPFVYATAFQMGLFPGTLVEDSPIDNRQVQIGGTAGILGEWGPENLENVHEGEITARYALAMSKGAATVRLGIRTGLDRVVTLAEKAGIRFLGDLKNFNATFLGRSGATMNEMCLAYAMFPNGGGQPQETYVIASIKDAKGQEIYAPKPTQSAQRAIDEYTAYQITSCLQDALEYGTGKKAYEKYGLGDFPVAGKSGTEYGFTDNWFIGFTSQVTCAVWAGFDQPKEIYPGAFSSDTVLPVWVSMMNASAEHFKPEAFVPPEKAQKVEICSVSGELATDACYEVDQSGKASRQVRSTYLEYVRPGTSIDTVCKVHGGPGAKPRTKPVIDANLLTLSSYPNAGGSPGLRAQTIALDSDPVLPVAPTVIGSDPYKSAVATLRAKVVLPETPALPKEEPEAMEREEVGAGEDVAATDAPAKEKEEEWQEVGSIFKVKPIARPVGPGEPVGPAPSEPIVARPVPASPGTSIFRDRDPVSRPRARTVEPLAKPAPAPASEEPQPEMESEPQPEPQPEEEPARIRLTPPKPIQFD